MVVSSITALLIVDLQKGFVTEWTQHLPSIVEDLQHKFEHIAYTRFINQEGSPFRRDFSWWEKFYPDSGDAETAFKPLPRAKEFITELYTAATPEVISFLKTRKIEEVYLAGISTEIAILKTAADLFELGFKVKVLSAYVGSYNGITQYHTGLDVLRRFIGSENIIETTWA